MLNSAELVRRAMIQRSSNYSLSIEQDLQKMRLSLGPDPMRFAPPRSERSIDEQLNCLTDNQRKCFETVLDRWEAKYPLHTLPDDVVLRFCRNCSGKPFDKKATWQALKKFRRNKDAMQRLLDLRASLLSDQLLTNTLFPVPDLQTKDQLDVFYMKPSRYAPKKTPLEDIIDNLAYVMNCMLEKESCNTKGIAFMANMNDWQMRKNFEPKYCFEFMQMLQGNRLPARVELFLIVNPKPWFDKVWKLMRPMMSDEFASKVFMIQETELKNHFDHGYNEFLPDEFQTGQASTTDMVTDFVTYRLCFEGSKGRISINAPPEIRHGKKPTPSRGKRLASMFAAKSA